jgi:hypothetical protein
LAANTPSDLVGDAANNIRVDGDLRARYNFFDLEIRMPEILGHLSRTTARESLY